MDVAKKISEKFNDYLVRKDNLKLEGWLFDFNEGLNIKLGLHNNKIGGPYEPPTLKEIYQGSAYLKWADKKISTVGIDATALEDLDNTLKEWKSMSYYDADAPDILEPLPMPTDLKIKDNKITDLATGKDKSYFFDTLTFFNKEFERKKYAKTIGGMIITEYSDNIIMNSKGLNFGWKENDMLVQIVVNDFFYDIYHKRKLPQKKDLNKIIKEIDGFMKHEQTSINSGVMDIIFTPFVLDSFLEKYFENLRGDLVVSNQSLYNVNDFKEKKLVFDKKINLVIDGLRDYSSSTRPCSGEGVPSTNQYLIANGRLITPLLNLKYAKKINMPPTSKGPIDFEIKKRISYKEMIKNIDYGLVVYGVLGMHTQDSTSGRYSLTADKGLLVKNGEIKGAVKDVVIAGDFFYDLRNKKTEFIDYRDDELAMKVKGSVITRGS